MVLVSLERILPTAVTIAAYVLVTQNAVMAPVRAERIPITAAQTAVDALTLCVATALVKAERIKVIVVLTAGAVILNAATAPVRAERIV